MIDWDKPLIAVPTIKGTSAKVSIIPVEIDRSYKRLPSAIPVRFRSNLWTGGLPGGTWYFNEEGEAIGGMNPEGGQDALWSIRNSVDTPVDLENIKDAGIF